MRHIFICRTRAVYSCSCMNKHKLTILSAQPRWLFSHLSWREIDRCHLCCRFRHNRSLNVVRRGHAPLFLCYCALTFAPAFSILHHEGQRLWRGREHHDNISCKANRPPSPPPKTDISSSYVPISIENVHPEQKNPARGRGIRISSGGIRTVLHAYELVAG